MAATPGRGRAFQRIQNSICDERHCLLSWKLAGLGLAFLRQAFGSAGMKFACRESAETSDFASDFAHPPLRDGARCTRVDEGVYCPRKAR